MGFVGPIEMEHRRSFFFGDHLNLDKITVSISVKTIFFFFFRRSSEFGQNNRFNFGEDRFFF